MEGAGATLRRCSRPQDAQSTGTSLVTLYDLLESSENDFHPSRELSNQPAMARWRVGPGELTEGPCSSYRCVRLGRSANSRHWVGPALRLGTWPTPGPAAKPTGCLSPGSAPTPIPGETSS